MCALQRRRFILHAGQHVAVAAQNSSELAKGLIKPSNFVIVHVFEEMGIRVHRLRDGRVPEQGLYDLRALALVEEFGREGVPQAVEGETLVS